MANTETTHSCYVLVTKHFEKQQKVFYIQYLIEGSVHGLC